MSKDSENENERLGREWMASEHWGGWRVGMVDGLLGSVVENAGDAVSWGRRRVWGRDPAEGCGGLGHLKACSIWNTSQKAEGVTSDASTLRMGPPT